MSISERIISTTLRNLSPLAFILAAKLAFITVDYGKYHGWFPTYFGG